MKIKDILVPANSVEQWILMHTVWNKKDNKGYLSIERCDNRSSYIPMDLVYHNEFDNKDELMKESKKQKGEWYALITSGRQAGPEPVRQFLPKV